jgi:hypothetical protein
MKFYCVATTGLDLMKQLYMQYKFEIRRSTMLICEEKTRNKSTHERQIKGVNTPFFMCGRMELPSLYTACAAEEKKGCPVAVSSRPIAQPIGLIFWFN